MGLAVIILVTLVAWMKSSIAMDSSFLCKDQPTVNPPDVLEVNATCYKKAANGTGPCQLTAKELLKIYKTPCYLACFLEGVGIVKDGNINLAGLTNHVNAIYSPAAAAIIEGAKLCTLPPPKADECSCNPYKVYGSCLKRSIKTNCKSSKGTSGNSTAAVPEKSRRRRAAETSTTMAKKNDDGTTSSSEENDTLPLANKA